MQSHRYYTLFMRSYSHLRENFNIFLEIISDIFKEQTDFSGQFVI